MDEINEENLVYGEKVVARIAALEWNCSKCGIANYVNSAEFSNEQPNGKESFVAGSDGYSVPCKTCGELNLLEIPVYEEAIIFGKEHTQVLLDCYENIDRSGQDMNMVSVLDVLSHGLRHIRQKKYSGAKDDKPWMSSLYISHKNRPKNE